MHTHTNNARMHTRTYAYMYACAHTHTLVPHAILLTDTSHLAHKRSPHPQTDAVSFLFTLVPTAPGTQAPFLLSLLTSIVYLVSFSSSSPLLVSPSYPSSPLATL